MYRVILTCTHEVNVRDVRLNIHIFTFYRKKKKRKNYEFTGYRYDIICMDVRSLIDKTPSTSRAIYVGIYLNFYKL